MTFSSGDDSDLPSEAEVAATAQPAIFLRQAAMPVPLDHAGCSYIGGLPRLPPELPWPELELYGEQRALTFLAQIDLAELPLIKSVPLPRTGTLFFFSNTNTDAPEPSEGRVIYHPGDTARLVVRNPPENAQPYGNGGRRWPWFADTSVWARTGFRFPLEFAKLNSYCDYVVRDGARLFIPRHAMQAHGNLWGRELKRCFGPLPTSDGDLDLWDVFRQDTDTWPFAWAAIEHGALAIAHAARHALLPWAQEPAEAVALYERIASTASKWIERAACERPYQRPDDATRSAFLKDWRALCAECEATSRRFKTYGRNPASELPGVLIAACFVCASHDATGVIPEAYHNALVQIWALDVLFTQHQMLGHGLAVQSAPLQYADQVMLLQLSGNEHLGWHSNIGCVLQFWIGHDALQRRDFDTVEMTLECD